MKRFPNLNAFWFEITMFFLFIAVVMVYVTEDVVWILMLACMIGLTMLNKRKGA